MALVKNVEPYSVDVGGRALAPGEGPVELDANLPAVAEQIDLGHLVYCVLPAVPPADLPADLPTDPPASEKSDQSARPARRPAPAEES